MSIKKWQTLESQYIVERPWLTARRDRVQLPNGTVHDEYYVLEYPDWVNVIAITREGKFVMIEQYRHGLGDVFTELVAGVIEPGEQPLSAAKRELKEETGYSGGQWQLLTTLSQNPSTTTNLTYCFLATDVELECEQHLDPTEDIEVKLMSETKVKALLVDDKIKQALMAAPLWKYLFLKNL